MSAWKIQIVGPVVDGTQTFIDQETYPTLEAAAGALDVRYPGISCARVDPYGCWFSIGNGPEIAVLVRAR